MYRMVKPKKKKITATILADVLVKVLRIIFPWERYNLLNKNSKYLRKTEDTKWSFQSIFWLKGQWFLLRELQQENIGTFPSFFLVRELRKPMWILDKLLSYKPSEPNSTKYNESQTGFELRHT